LAKPKTKPRKSRPPASNRIDPPGASTDNVVLRATVAGALMFQRAYPAWVLPHDPPRRGQLHSFGSSPLFAHLPKVERDAIFGSVGKTYTRAAHHERKFGALRAELDERRRNLPGEVFWDGLVEYVHFELQSFAGACRTLFDELAYIIARRHGVAPARARRTPWETADLLCKPLKPECDVDEVTLLRSERTWFETLNAYRNSFSHHGWQHGWGHFSNEDSRYASGSAASNGLLLPDRESLVGRKKPFEWTWARKTTADAVAAAIRRGTDRLIDEFGRLWSVPLPATGSMPLEDRPNMIVRLVRPGILYTEFPAFLPVFSTRELGLACQALANKLDIELVDAPLSTMPLGRAALTVALHGIDPTAYGTNVTHLDIVLNPDHNPDWTEVGADSHTRIALGDLAARPATEPLVIPLDGCDRVWLWQRVEPRTW
jgi:hypothetical protein